MWFNGVSLIWLSIFEVGVGRVGCGSVECHKTIILWHRISGLIQAGQVIAREDISIRVEKLEGDYRWDLERLNQQLSQVQIQLLAAREDLRETESEREELESELGKLEFQSLFAREYLRLQDSLASASARAEDNREKMAMLEQRQKLLNEQVEVRSEQLSSGLMRGAHGRRCVISGIIYLTTMSDMTYNVSTIG